jgi:hypothetical protein
VHRTRTTSHAPINKQMTRTKAFAITTGATGAILALLMTVTAVSTGLKTQEARTGAAHFFICCAALVATGGVAALIDQERAA